MKKSKLKLLTILILGVFSNIFAVTYVIPTALENFYSAHTSYQTPCDMSYDEAINYFQSIDSIQYTYLGVTYTSDVEFMDDGQDATPLSLWFNVIPDVPHLNYRIALMLYVHKCPNWDETVYSNIEEPAEYKNKNWFRVTYTKTFPESNISWTVSPAPDSIKGDTVFIPNTQPNPIPYTINYQILNPNPRGEFYVRGTTTTQWTKPIALINWSGQGIAAPLTLGEYTIPTFVIASNGQAKLECIEEADRNNIVLTNPYFSYTPDPVLTESQLTSTLNSIVSSLEDQLQGMIDEHQIRDSANVYALFNYMQQQFTLINDTLFAFKASVDNKTLSPAVTDILSVASGRGFQVDNALGGVLKVETSVVLLSPLIPLGTEVIINGNTVYKGEGVLNLSSQTLTFEVNDGDLIVINSGISASIQYYEPAI